MNIQFDATRELDTVFGMTSEALARITGSRVPFEREWLRVDEVAGARLVVEVPIGRDLVLDVHSDNLSGHNRDFARRQFADDLAKSLVNIEAARWSLRRYAGAMRRVSAAVIDKAVREGFEYAFEKVTFKQARACHLAHPDWREAASHVIARVHFTGLGDQLRQVTHQLIIEEPEYVEDEIRAFDHEQLEHQRARDALRAQGADIAVDEITLRHLDRYGIDRLEALRSVAANGATRFEVTKRNGCSGKLSLRSDAGVVRCHIIDDPDFVWIDDVLALEGPSTPADPASLASRLVSDVCPDDIYSGLRLGSLRSRGRFPTFTIEQATHLVDLATGRIWERAA
ncbi:hypothetical protein [Sphingomonas beigongshangi]|uniref:hypothetical protein n=1 Tax=Sphingomonas beigongshangi TaxID=2782540 RepID=UPI001AEDA2CE|nr:hypothetical protein [Sphingomonas beigongshangi]